MSKVEGPVRIWIKPKVLAGFVIILAFAIASISITYNGFVELIKARQSLSHPNKKLVALNSALADIYEAESNIRAYNLSQNEDYLNVYFSFLIKVNDRVDSLLLLTKDNSSQHAKIKSIKKLLEKKEKVLNEFIDLKKRDRSAGFYDRALEEINKAKTDPGFRKPILSKTTTITTSKRDTVVERAPNPKAGFFGKIKNWITGKEKVDTSLTDTRVITKVDTIMRTGYVSDSVMGNVVGILNKIRSEQENAKAIVSSKELDLLKSDKELMDQIRVIVSLLEREELSLSYRRTVKAEEVVHRSTIIVLALGGAALILLLLFVAVIFRDITKSNYYRNELYEAKKYAEKLLKIKEQFLANMSHEIRTPLSSIIGISRQIEKTKLDSKQAEYVKLMSASSNHLLGVINDILDFSKIEAGQLKIEILPFNLNELLQETVKLMHQKAEEKGISIELIDQQNDTPTLFGDPFRLKQIIYNLLSNAIKFTDSGSITVKSWGDKLENDFFQLQLSITDTGIGISEEQQKIIFEEFTQADPSTSRRFGGTGLGLTIVKRLVELQGGEISIESKLNEGTTFIITIPYRTTGDIASVNEKPKANLKLGRDIKALVVDDDEVNRVITEELFKSLNILVESSSDPLLAIEMISSNRFDIVFTDIHMPNISGYEMVERINQLGMSIPIIAITANSTIDNPSHFAEKGFAGHLIKPYAEPDIARVLESVFGYSNESEVKIDNSNESDKSYDLSDIYRFSGGDNQAVKMILQTFLDNTDKNLHDLNRFISLKDLKGASAIAHKMKSAFNQFKILNIAGLLFKIERIEDAGGDIYHAKELVDELNVQIRPIIKSLRKELAGLSV